MRRGLLRCGAAALLFGASTPFAARLTGDMGPVLLAGLLYLGAALAVLPQSLHRPPSVAGLRRGAGRLTLAVVFGGLIGPILLMLGLARTPAASASLLLNLELPFTVLLAGILFREHLGPRVVLGAGLVAGAGALVALSAGTPSVQVGGLLVAAACAAWAVDNVVTADLDELAPAHVTLVKGVVAGTLSTVVGLASGGFPAVGPFLLALLVGALGYGASITLWVAGARDLGAARAQVVFATAPFLGAVLAWVVLREGITVAQVAGLVVAISGVALVLRSSHEHEHEHPAQEHDHEHTHDDGHHDHQHTPEVPAGTRHQHPHRHEALVHAHPHVPDLHHRHSHP
jgi:drug/metabolite transporter (DMT)-like permease